MFPNTILVGVDFSEAGARALHEARGIARLLGTEPYLLHATAHPRRWTPEEDESAWMEREGVDPDRVLARHGTPWVELARHAIERDSFMIVVGSHGRGGYQRVGLGSTAVRLTLAATRPVLVVGQRTTAPDPRPLIAAVR